MPVVAENKMRNPLLRFAASEGVVVVVITQNEIRSPPSHIWSEQGGGVVPVVTKNKIRNPPPLTREREGGGGCCLEQTRNPPSHVWSEEGGGGGCPE